MNVHQNARLTPHGRERIVRQVESGQTPRPTSAQIIAAQSKLARIAWTVLAQERSYEARVTTAAA